MKSSRRRWWTPARRRAIGETMRERWRAGVFAHRPKRVRPDAWTPAELALLDRLAGVRTPAEIASAFLSELGSERTETAVLIRLKRLGYSPSIPTWNAQGLALLFGVNEKTIVAWCRRGELRGRQVRPGLRGSSWIFMDADLRAFIERYPNVYDYRRMLPGRWRTLAETVWRSDLLLTVEETARALGVPKPTVLGHCIKGWLPTLRRSEQHGSQRGRYLIRRSSLRLFRYRRPERVKRVEVA